MDGGLVLALDRAVYGVGGRLELPPPGRYALRPWCFPGGRMLPAALRTPAGLMLLAGIAVLAGFVIVYVLLMLAHVV